MNTETQTTSIQEILSTFGGVQLENLYDESVMDMPWLKNKLTVLLDENILHTMNNDWSSRSKMNKLLIDNERSNTTIFTLRIGGRKIVRYSFPTMSMAKRCQFLNKYKSALNAGAFDEVLSDFLAKQLEASQKRKEATRNKRNEKNRQKRLEIKKQKEMEKMNMFSQAH